MRFNDDMEKFDYCDTQLQDVKTYGVRSTRTGRVTVTAIEIHGEVFAPSLCFWRSFFNRFNIPTAVLRLFEPSEILERVKQREGDAEIRFSVHRDAAGDGTIMVICADESNRQNRLNSVPLHDVCEDTGNRFPASAN